MKWYYFVMVFMVLLGAVTLSYQIYRLTELDARCRGLKHPKFWGVFSMSGNNGSSGLLLYLIGRRKYPIEMKAEEKAVMDSHKNKAGVSLIFLALGTIALFAVAILEL